MATLFNSTLAHVFLLKYMWMCAEIRHLLINGKVMFVNVCVCSVIGPQKSLPFHSHQKPGLSHANQTLLKQTCAFRVESLFI